jgi:uncharacterized membrane protein YkoI
VPSSDFQQRRLVGRLATLLCVGLLSLPVTAVQAQQLLLAQQSAGPDAAQAVRISQREALELVRARFPGNVVSISEVQQDGALQYRVRMDNDGNIFTVYVDAVTGDIRREQ